MQPKLLFDGRLDNQVGGMMALRSWMHSEARRLVLAALALLIANSVALAEERHALLIANADYPSEVGALFEQPGRDVDKIAAALRAAGFASENVDVQRDLGREGLNRAVRGFQRRLRDGGEDLVGFFYYAGHGASTQLYDEGGDFLLPAKTSIVDAEDLIDRGYSPAVKEGKPRDAYQGMR